MPPTSKMVTSEVLMCGLKKGPVVRTAFEVVNALRISHAQTVIADRAEEIDTRLTHWDRRTRDVVAEEIRAILGNLARPDVDGDSLAEEIRKLRQIQEQGWNLSFFEGLLLQSTHLPALRRNPQHYGRILADRDAADPTRGFHILLDADTTHILELTPSAFSQLLANQARGIPGARMGLSHGVWAFPEAKAAISTEPGARNTPSTHGETLIASGPAVFPSPWFANSLGMAMVRIEPGEFLMGSDEAQIDRLMKHFPELKREWLDDERPQHPVAITRPFYLASQQVTVGQYRRFVEASGYGTDGGWRNPGFAQEDDHPIVNVSYDDVMFFFKWLNEQEKGRPRGYRLPTEAEWEYACRAGGTGVYGSTDDPAKLDRVAWFSANAKGVTHPVGQKGMNAFGLHDMLGNAWEWCDDWFDEGYYGSSPRDDPRNIKEATERVFRGGSLINAPWNCRPAYRNRYAPEDRNVYLGFRVAAVRQ